MTKRLDSAPRAKGAPGARLLGCAAALLAATLTSAGAGAQTSTSTAAAVGTSTAAGDAEARARAHAERGKALYGAGDYVQAIASFQQAYALVESAAVAYNVGRCHERLSQWAEAIRWYELYVQKTVDARDRAETAEKIELLRRKLGPEALGPDGQYQARVQDGRSAYAKGDYEGAIAAFKAAFDLKASPGPLYNIARSYEKMGRYEEAIDFYRQYLDIDPKATDRADVEETVRRLQKSLRERFQELSVSSDPPGAEVYLDDRNTGLQGQTNFRGKITPGPHTLYIDLNGYEPIKRDFVMPDDKPLALDFKMKRLENVGRLEISVDREGARIFVDGAIVGLSPYRQKKVVEAGPHQIQVELPGYERYSEIVEVARDQDRKVDVVLVTYKPPVRDDTLSAWGRNLMLIGIVGGGLGFGAPVAYQKLLVRRPFFSELGPERTDGDPFFRGPGAGLRENGELKTLKLVQTVSLIAGGTFTAAGLGFYFYKWFRNVPPPPTATARRDDEAPWLRVEAMGFAPSADGAAFGLSGSFGR